MPLVILQPSANKGAREHYRDTIQSPVPYGAYEQLSGAQSAALKGAFPSGTAPMWGVTPGGRNPQLWERCSPGDLVLFAANKRIFGSGIVALKFHNQELARQLWGSDAEGRTWEYMYALDEIRSLNVSYSEFNRWVGYNERAVIQDFRVLSAEKSEQVFEALDLYSEAHIPAVSAEAFRRAATAPSGPLDVERTATQRTESRYIRSVLFPESTGTCDLCGERMPISFLVGAHIKKRAACSDDEKVDIPNIVMAACLFGCDALYERGYVTVGEDWLLQRTSTAESTWLEARLAHLGERAFPHRDAARAQYFAWHRSNVFPR